VAAGTWGAPLRAHVREDFGRYLAIRIYAEHLPDDGNRVTLDPEVTDHFGSPAPRITFSVGIYERRALEEAREIAVRILRLAGAERLWASDITLAAHQIGTHRMGRDPDASVVDPNLRAHDVENLYLLGSGAFVTSSASPPTLTIAALALRAADHIAAALLRGPRPGLVGRSGPARPPGG
jgi:choline dehydrogenase-like flavoprotein